MNKKLSKKYIKKELERLLYIFGQDKVIRYNAPERPKTGLHQSVSEHITNLILLAYYFKDLEKNAQNLNWEKLIHMLLVHDMVEIEVGDMITNAKTEAHKKKELAAIKTVEKKTPDFVKKNIAKLCLDYDYPKSKEAKFAKALDKFEGKIYWMQDAGIKTLKKINKDIGKDIKEEHPDQMNKISKMLVEYDFPVMLQYLEVIDEVIRSRKLF